MPPTLLRARTSPRAGDAAHRPPAQSQHMAEPPVREVSVRSPADALRLVVGVLALVTLLVVTWIFGDTLIGFTSDLLRGLDALPHWIVTGAVVTVRVLAVLFVVAGVALTILRSGARLLLQVALAVLVAVAITVLLDDVPHVDVGDLPASLGVGLGPFTDARF